MVVVVVVVVVVAAAVMLMLVVTTEVMMDGFLLSVVNGDWKHATSMCPFMKEFLSTVSNVNMAASLVYVVPFVNKH